MFNPVLNFQDLKPETTPNVEHFIWLYKYTYLHNYCTVTTHNSIFPNTPLLQYTGRYV